MPLTQQHIGSDDNRWRNGLLYPVHGIMDFEELEDKSKILAHILRESGCEEGDPICLMMDKSIDFWITLRGIEYAGCVSVLLNPYDPVDSIQSAVFKTGAQWIIADRNAKQILNSERFGRRFLSIGWMDNTDVLPDGCYPEFVKDNLNHIAMRPVLPEPDENSSIIHFNSFSQNGKKELDVLTQFQIERFLTPVLEFVGLDSHSRVAGLMSPDSPSVLLEMLSLFTMNAELLMGHAGQDFSSEKLFQEIQQQDITHILLESADVEKFAINSLVRGMRFPMIENTVVWGELSSKSEFRKLHSVFPNADICKITRGTAQRLWVQDYKFDEKRFVPVISIPAVNRNHTIADKNK